MISQFGSNILQFVIVIWIALEYESALLLGVSAFVGFTPFIVITPFAGVLVDRWNRKKVIISMDFLQALITTALILLFVFDAINIPLLLLILALRSSCQAFHAPAVDAIVPLLVPPEKLSRLNGWTWLVFGVIGIIGAPMAVFLLLFFEIHEVLLLDPLTFLLALVPALIIKIPSVRENQTDKESSFKEDFAEGIEFIQERRGLLSLLSVFTAVNLLIQPFSVLLPLFVFQVHSFGKTEFAILIAAQSAGMLLGRY